MLQGKIFDKWITPELTEDEKKLVFEIDDTILYYEFLELFGEKIFEYVPTLVSEPNFEYVEFSKVENEFLGLFYTLTGK